jgi:hypothetical protein
MNMWQFTKGIHRTVYAGFYPQYYPRFQESTAGLGTYLSYRGTSIFPLFLLPPWTCNNFSWETSLQFSSVGFSTKWIQHVFLDTHRIYDYNNVYIVSTNLEAAHCCGMHVAQRGKTWEENQEENLRRTFRTLFYLQGTLIIYYEHYYSSL